jgi:hypothetical protein
MIMGLDNVIASADQESDEAFSRSQVPSDTAKGERRILLTESEHLPHVPDKARVEDVQTVLDLIKAVYCPERDSHMILRLKGLKLNELPHNLTSFMADTEGTPAIVIDADTPDLNTDSIPDKWGVLSTDMFVESLDPREHLVSKILARKADGAESTDEGEPDDAV